MTENTTSDADQFVSVREQLGFAARWNFLSAVLWAALALVFAPEMGDALVTATAFASFYTVIFSFMISRRLDRTYRGEQPGFFLLELPDIAKILPVRSQLKKMLLTGLLVLIPFAVVFGGIAVADGSDIAGSISIAVFLLCLILAGLFAGYWRKVRITEESTGRAYYAGVGGINPFSRESRELRRFIYFQAEQNS